MQLGWTISKRNRLRLYVRPHQGARTVISSWLQPIGIGEEKNSYKLWLRGKSSHLFFFPELDPIFSSLIKPALPRTPTSSEPLKEHGIHIMGMLVFTAGRRLHSTASRANIERMLKALTGASHRTAMLLTPSICLVMHGE